MNKITVPAKEKTQKPLTAVGAIIQKEIELENFKKSLPKTTFHVLSDLHFERSPEDLANWPTPDPWPHNNGKTWLILAGDIANFKTDIDDLHAFLKRRAREYFRVIYVLGDAECKGLSFTKCLFRARAIQNQINSELKEKKLLVMENDNRIDIPLDLPEKHTSIIGTSLWSGLTSEMISKHQDDPEFDGIKENTVFTHNYRFRTAFKYLEDEVRKIRAEKGGAWRKIIIVTHHSSTSINPDGNIRLAPLKSNWSHIGTDILAGIGLEGFGMGDMWINGHFHSCRDEGIDGARAYTNARGGKEFDIAGDPRRGIKGFDFDRIIEF